MFFIGIKIAAYFIDDSFVVMNEFRELWALTLVWNVTFFYI